MKKVISIILVSMLLLTLCACGEESVSAPKLSERLKDVIAQIDAIPELAEDGSNYDEVFSKYSDASAAYFKLDYDDMGLVTNVGKMWKAGDICSKFMESLGNGYNPVVSGNAGELLQGTWYNSSGITYQERYVIEPDGRVEAPYSWEEVYNYVTSYPDEIFGEIYDIPYYGTVYADYSMGSMRLARTDGMGCLLPQDIVDTVFVSVELNEENVADYISLDRIYSYLNEWGDTVNYLEEGISCFAMFDAKYDTGITFIGSSDLQVELLQSDGKKQTFYNFGLVTMDGKSTYIKGFGRAKGTLYYVKSQYVASEVLDEYGSVTVTLNDGSTYYYYQGSYAFG